MEILSKSQTITALDAFLAVLKHFHKNARPRFSYQVDQVFITVPDENIVQEQFLPTASKYEVTNGGVKTLRVEN